MRFSSQNLSDGRRHIFWHGRAWLGNFDKRQLHWEWSFGKFAGNFAMYIAFGTGDDDAGLCLHMAIPWVFSIFVTLDGVYRCKECEIGVTIHDSSFWIYPLAWRMESATKEDPWYRHTYCWNFPWALEWYSTEILAHAPNDGRSRVFWREDRKNRKPFCNTSYEHRKSIEDAVSKTYDYAYILKNREIQNRKAKVHVERMTHRARWWPIIPRQKVSTYIDVEFDQEVGEETGSWKGGCVGCSYQMKWGETPERCLSRMEHEREFRR